jgi:protein-disulfide isomerase
VVARLSPSVCAGLTPPEPLSDLAVPVDLEHVRGRPDAPVTLLEYRNYEYPYCGRAGDGRPL